MKKVLSLPRILSLLIIVILIGIFIVSCSKNSASENYEKQNKITYDEVMSSGSRSANEQTDSLDIVKNPNNQYDKAGELHNSMVAYFITTSTLPITNGKEIIYTFDRYFKNSSGIDSLASTAVLGSTQIAFAQQFENASDKYAFLTQGIYMSPVGVSYYRKLDSVYDNAASANSLYASFKTIEAQIIASNLVSRDKRTLLEAASIGRFSAYYWNKAIVNKG